MQRLRSACQPVWYRQVRAIEDTARGSPETWRRCLAWPALFVMWFITNHPWIVIFLVKPSDDFRHSHLVIILFNMILAELCFFIIFYGHGDADTSGQQFIGVVLDEGIKWLLLIFYQRLFRWAMAEPEIQTLELQVRDPLRRPIHLPRSLHVSTCKWLPLPPHVHVCPYLPRSPKRPPPLHDLRRSSLIFRHL